MAAANKDPTRGKNLASGAAVLCAVAAEALGAVLHAEIMAVV